MTDRDRPAGRRRSVLRRLSWLLAVLMLAGCATVPSGGPPVDYARVADPGAQVKDTTPASGLSPQEIVRGFIAASARIDQDSKLTAARSFLTSSAQKTWQAAPTNVMILSTAPRYDVVPDQDGDVELSASTDGYLSADGSFVPTARTDFQVIVSTVQVDGQWRIASPPDELIMYVGDFNLAYTQREVYFINSTGTLMVPDRRWLPNRSLYPATMADQLITRLINGPSASLLKAVRNGLSGVSQRSLSAVSADGVLQIDLTGVSTLTTANIRVFAAQIVYSLRSDAARIRILVDGAALDAAQPIWTTGVLGTFDPDGVPGSGSPGSSGFYLNPNGALVNLQGVAVWGNAGTGELHAVSAAMSAATGDLAVVGTTPAGQTLYIGKPVDQQPMQQRLTGASFTAPSFSRSGDEVWVVANAGTSPEVYRLLTAGSRYPVDASSLTGLGPITALAVSPDGARVVLVAGSKLYLSTVVYSDDPTGATGTETNGSGAAATLTAPVQLRTELTVGQAIWSDSRNILVTASDPSSTYRTVWRIGMDGRQRSLLTVRGIFADVDAVAVIGALPTLISSGGRIFRLDGDDTSGQWLSVNADGSPAFGSWPLYPA